MITWFQYFDIIGTINLYICRYYLDEYSISSRREVSPIYQIRISYDSNLRYLPLMYFLPEDLIAKYPTLRILPRKVREIMYDKQVMALVDSDAFLNEIMDATAALVFPYFGFGGWKEHYTGYCPIWELSYTLPLWSKLLEKEIGWGLQALMNIPSTQRIPFFTSEYVKEIIKRVVKRGIQEEGWQPILNAVREMPGDEDFEKWDTNVRKDFLRKWYHTRSKRVQTVSLEACMEDEVNGIHEIADASYDFVENVAAEDFYKGFNKLLSTKDMEILQLRAAGFTYEEIAGKLQYKNHSGVLKRIKAIQKAFQQYEEQQ